MTKGKLYVIATPIGNLGDLSSRAILTLKRVDLILAEDTRTSGKLLAHFQIEAPMLSYHQHSKMNKVDKIIGLLKQGKQLALVSDAGTPGVSDPGNKLIEQILKELGRGVEIIPIPGPSSVLVAASISGFAMDKFSFLGFPPAKNKRNKFFDQVKDSPYPIVLFESPHRILKTLAELPQDRQIVVCRELTKKFESTYRGTAEEVAKQIENDKVKGEFVVVVSK